MSAKGSTASIAFQETLDLLEWPRLCDHLSNFASTLHGQRICRSLPLPPDRTTSCLRLAETIEMGALDDLIEGGVSFQGVNELGQILSRCFKGGVASGEELLNVAETLSAARRLRRQIDNPELRPALTALLADLATLPELEQCLKFGLEEGGRVADRASANLAQLRRQRHELRLERQDHLCELLRRYASMLQDTVVAERHGRPVLAFKAGSVARLPGLVHDSSASGNTVFLEPQTLIPLGNRLAELETRICYEEQLLLKQWSAAVAENFEALEHLAGILLQLDLALARGRYGKWLGGIPPIIKEDAESPFSFEELLNPLLLWQQRYEEGGVVVPINVEVPSALRVVVITGSNTGGKTAILKSVGLATLMARAGLLVPCAKSPTLPWCAQVLADIGDEQSLQQNLSTFSGHVRRIGRILEALADRNGHSLVLLDEIGAGTDPAEGSALAMALLRTFANNSRLTIATTHFGELKTLKYTDPRYENASVEFNSETLSPTYKLQWGIPGRSNALAIATRLGIAPDVISLAKELLGPIEGTQVNEVIMGLEEQRKRQQSAAEDAAALLARTELLHEELLARWRKQCQQSEEVQKAGRQKLEKSIRAGQREVRSLIRRLRQEGADGDTARRAGQRLLRIETENRLKPDRRKHQGWCPQVGERIRLLALGKAADVLAISEDGSQLTVLCGVFRSKVDIAEVESLDGCRAIAPEPVVNVLARADSTRSSEVRMTSNTVDIRGLRAHEAEAVVEEHLRGAVGPVWIVHGIGSGKLKIGLRKWLESVPYVECVRDADRCDGGPGCSVVWLR